MIPYEELVVALQTWRARQGLPVTQLSGSLAMPPPAPPAKAPPPPMQSKPPAPPPKTPVPPPLQRPSHDSLDVEDAALLDDGVYEPEGDNFSMKFGQHEVEHDAEATNVAEAGRPSADGFGALTDPNPLDGLHEQTEDLPDPKGSIRSGNRNDDW